MGASFARGRSAHWPVKSVTGRIERGIRVRKTGLLGNGAACTDSHDQRNAGNQEAPYGTGRRTTLSLMLDGYSREWCTELRATSPVVSSKFRPPVFRLRSKRGKFELDTSMRMRCPVSNTLLVVIGCITTL